MDAHHEIIGSFHVQWFNNDSVYYCAFVFQDALADNDNVMSFFTPWIQAAFVMASIWGYGGNLDTQSLGLFDTFFRDLWKGDYSEDSAEI